jgi:hypothetical protein
VGGARSFQILSGAGVTLPPANGSNDRGTARASPLQAGPG